MFHLMNRLRKERKGFLAVVVTGVVSLLAATILLSLGPVITASVHNSIPAQTGIANTTIEAVFTASYNAYNMATVYPVLIIAVGLIGVIISGFGIYAIARGRGAY